jgi:transposase-like protein
MRSTENVGHMSQHFLLSTAARSLSLAKVARMSEEEARDAFRLIRWSDTNGEPVCPRCQCAAVYAYQARPLFKCKACNHQFSVTSGTIFASRKLPIATYLMAIAIFVNGAKGHSALQLSRDLDCQYKTAFVLPTKSVRRWRPRCAASELEREPRRSPARAEPNRQAPCRRRHARARLHDAALRVPRGESIDLYDCRAREARARQFLPTKPRHGTCCTRAISRSG